MWWAIGGVVLVLAALGVGVWLATGKGKADERRKRAEDELEGAQEVLELHTRGDATPGVVLRVLRHLRGRRP